MAALGVATIAATACTPPAEPTPTLKVTASSATIHYGDEVPAITATYSATPTTEATCSTEATSSSPVGVYDTVCEGAALTGRTVTYVKGKITIEAAPVTVTASSATIMIGDAIPTITPSYSGFKNGTTAPAVEAVCSTEATAASPAGTYSSSCSGAEADNYSFSYVDGTVQIVTAVVTVTASSGTSTYGDDAPEISASYAGFALGETEPAVPATCSSASDASSDVGTYASSCSGASDPSYSFNYVDGTVEVTPASLNVIASSASFVAGGAVPAITASYSGLVNDDTAPATAPVCSTDATSSSPAGTYTSSCSGAADGNYDISYTNGTVTVTAAAAPVVVTASSATITYGEAIPGVTATYTGFAGGQTDPASPAACSTTATAGSAVGTYETTCSGAADPAYTFTYTPGTITIVPAAATVTASSASTTYGGSVPAVTASYSGLVNGDTAPATPATCSTTATAASDAGTYATTCSGADDGNYTFSYTPGSVTIGQKSATVTASNASFDSGTMPPAITASYSGLVNGDTSPATPAVCTTNATAASPAGTYASTCSGAADGNYTFSYVDGVVTVNTPALPPVTATGYAGYSTLTKATTVSAASNGVALPNAAINVASTAAFSTYQNLTVVTTTGAQSMFCKAKSATAFSSCSANAGASGTMATGNTVTDAAVNGFDVYTLMGGAAAVSPSSLTIIQDIPAAFRGMDSRITATATNGVINVLPMPASTGTFNLVFGICDAGTATYSASNPNCRAGEIVYGPGAVSSMGAKVQVSIASSDVYQKLSTYIAAPAQVSQGETFSISAAATGTAVPRLQSSSVGDATVNTASGFGIIFPIPAGMEFVSASSSGGNAISSGKMVVTYCAATGGACDAKLTGNYDWTKLPYIKVTLPGVSIAGGAQMTMPTIKMTLKAVGPVGTVANATLTEFLLDTNITAPFIGGATAKFDGYPTDPNATSGTPPKFAPNVLGSIEITD